jgi:hypothetical protein
MEIPIFRPKRDRRALPRLSSHDLARSTPEDGDVVVRQETREGTVVYVLRTAPGPDGYLFRTGDEAISQAVTFAKRHRVRAWFSTDESADFVLLGAMREGKFAVCDGRLRDTLQRLRAAFLEIPCLRLTPAQAQRLCGVELTVCNVMLALLVDEEFLSMSSDGHYARLTTGPQSRPAKADHGTDTHSKEAS